MSLPDIELGDGATFSRRCNECETTVTILTPNKNGHGADQTRWTHWRNLIRAQVPWPLMCRHCKQWWNEHLDATER